MKNLLLAAAFAALAAAPATADVLNFSLEDLGAGWSSSYNAETKTITYDSAWSGRGWWFDGADYTQYDEVFVQIEPVDWMCQVVVEFSDKELGSQTFPIVAGDKEVVGTLDEAGKLAVAQIYLQSSQAGDITLVAAGVRTAGPEIEYDAVDLTMDGPNLLLAEFVDMPDDQLIRVTLSISNAESEVAAGWGVGGIYPINVWSGAAAYNFTAKEVSKEGALNKYDFTAADFRKFAKDENGEYHTDDYDQQGLSFNVYNGASLVSVQALTPKGNAVNNISVDDSNATAEFFNLQGVRVANPENGIFIRRQGNKVSKVVVR